jgi:hypothetical protein
VVGLIHKEIERMNVSISTLEIKENKREREGYVTI